MNVKELLEASYAGKPPSWTSHIKGRIATKELNQFVRSHKKILDEVFEVLKVSFMFFYEMSIDYMDEDPEEFGDEERDPEGIALAWHEGWTDDFNLDEDPAYQAAIKQIKGEEFDDVISFMNDFIITNAERIVNEN